MKEDFEDIERIFRIHNLRKDSTKARRKGTTGQTTICKTLHRKLKIEQHEPH